VSEDFGGGRDRAVTMLTLALAAGLVVAWLGVLAWAATRLLA
jgi:hypothetical protein